MKAILFVGPGKTGTSFIYKYLKNHPELSPSNVKETGHFFDPKGSFSKFFDLKDDIKYVYEVSNTYFKSTVVMANIASAGLADVHIVIIRRDPVERALSHVKFIVRNGNSGNDPKKLLDQFPEVIESSRYRHFETLWKKNFGPATHFIDYDSDPVIFAEALNAFLLNMGLSKVESVPEIVNKSMSPRSRGLAKLAKLIATTMRNVGMLGALQRVKDSVLVNRIIFSEKNEVRVDESAFRVEIVQRLENVDEI